MELAEARVEQERDASVARARASLPSGGGYPFCSCGNPIPEARRLALPGVTSCIECAKARESRGRR
ncbi:TraR/DksA C4-type zinc finger protein [Devosia sp.]|uniref:TraR/DksA C4-type zinc finger protein n=1 Tax=Devosia sp. TaxID=1871048 RepID=UPI001AD2A3B7|nr:TraR/DksA C4-type zinc finger protein [Devosia sp.]MBN9333877.1 TraR/DksA C4-type zinc finger protein [Devosia sp.]